MAKCLPVFKWSCAEEKNKDVQGDQRGEGGFAGCAGDASAGEASGEQEAPAQGEAQAQPGQAAGGCRSRMSIVPTAIAGPFQT